MDMGTFILGVLFGWLAEWIYVTFFGNKGSEGLSDCTAYERELRTRNEEIKSLKATLAGTTSGSSLMRTPVVGKNSASAKKSSPSKSKVALTNTSSSTKKTTAKSATVKTSTPAKKPAKVATKKATSTTKKPTAKNSTKTTPTQATAKKAPVRKPRSKKIALKKDIKLNNPSGDDLTKLSGIGPSMAATMNELGITNYAKLAAMDDDILRDMLEASGARLNNNKEAMDSWNEQATLADKGDFEGLKKLQKALKS